jgi:hypothetical protein
MFHTHVASLYPKCFICFKYMLHSSVSCCKCRSSALVSLEGGQGQAVAIDAWRRCRPPPVVWGGDTGHAVLLWKRRGASHPGSMGRGSEAGGSDASAENKGGAGGARIWADETEQPRTSECYYASSVAGFSLAELLCEQISSRLGLICTRKGRGRPTSVPLRNNNWYNNNTKCMFFVDHT